MIEPTPRVPYATAGTVGRKATERALKHAALPKGNPNRITAIHLRVFLAVVSQTALYSKVSDRLFIARIKELTQIADDRNVRRAIDRLAGLGLITWEPGRGRGKVSLVGLPAIVESRVEPDPASVSEIWKAGSCATGDTGSGVTQETGSGTTRLPSSPIEKYDRAAHDGETYLDSTSDADAEQLRRNQAAGAAYLRNYIEESFGAIE